jgi:hypothetical protein
MILKNIFAIFLFIISFIIIVIEFYIINNIVIISYKDISFKIPRYIFNLSIKIYALNKKSEEHVKKELLKLLIHLKTILNV